MGIRTDVSTRIYFALSTLLGTANHCLNPGCITSLASTLRTPGQVDKISARPEVLCFEQISTMQRNAPMPSALVQPVEFLPSIQAQARGRAKANPEDPE